MGNTDEIKIIISYEHSEFNIKDFSNCKSLYDFNDVVIEFLEEKLKQYTSGEDNIIVHFIIDGVKYEPEEGIKKINDLRWEDIYGVDGLYENKKGESYGSL